MMERTADNAALIIFRGHALERKIILRPAIDMDTKDSDDDDESDDPKRQLTVAMAQSGDKIRQMLHSLVEVNPFLMEVNRASKNCNSLRKNNHICSFVNDRLFDHNLINDIFDFIGPEQIDFQTTIAFIHVAMHLEINSDDCCWHDDIEMMKSCAPKGHLDFPKFMVWVFDQLNDDVRDKSIYKIWQFFGFDFNLIEDEQQQQAAVTLIRRTRTQLCEVIAKQKEKLFIIKYDEDDSKRKQSTKTERSSSSMITTLITFCVKLINFSIQTLTSARHFVKRYRRPHTSHRKPHH